MQITITGEPLELRRFASDLRGMTTDHGDLVASEIEDQLQRPGERNSASVNLDTGSTTSAGRGQRGEMRGGRVWNEELKAWVPV